MNDEHAETEARLRAALSTRAESVQPTLGDPQAAAAAGARVRRRHTFLAAAAVVALVASVAGAAVVLGGDGTEDVASGPETTTTTTTPIEGIGAPVIWPLPTMSLQYETPEQAAEAFMSGYVGVDRGCERRVPADDGYEVVCPSGGPAPSCPGTAAGPACPIPGTLVDVEQRGLGWVVLGAESTGFQVDNPGAGDVVGPNIEVDVRGLDLTNLDVLSAELRPLGEPAGSVPQVGGGSSPPDADGSWHLILGAADGPVVLVVSDGASVTARVITVDSEAVPAETTTTTTGPTDDGTVGWPGNTSRVFEDPRDAALALATEVLEFAQPVIVATPHLDSPDAEVLIDNRPGGTTTIFTIHDTGSARGWVVTALRCYEFSEITSVSRDGDNVAVTGTATAFEATINVRLVTAEGEVLGETITMAGANGEIGPFSAVVHQDVPSGSTIYVQIAEGDASGEGRFTWATWAEVPA